MLLTALLSQFPATQVKPEPQPWSGGDGREFMWLGGAETGFGASGVVLHDDGRRLAIAARGIPMGFALACLALPFVVAAAVFIYRVWAYGRYEWMILPIF